MFSKSARFYDVIYGWKDYAAEVQTFQKIVTAFQAQPVRTLLDVACGTGQHLSHLQPFYQVGGLDLDAELLQIAAQKLPDVPLHHGDMRTFRLHKTFDCVACLFSSIGYVVTVEALHQTIQNFAWHTSAGGLVIVEPWFTKSQFTDGHISVLTVDEPDIKITRMNHSQVRGDVSYLNFHYLVGLPDDGIHHFTEVHELGLFHHEDYLAAFHQAGLTVYHDANGLDGRGLYIGQKPPLE
jgi:SAM-dependent methyltransferase